MFLFSRRPFFSCSSFSSLEMENKVTVRRSFSSGADCKLLRQTHKNRIMQRVFFVRFVREIFVFISFFVLNGGRKDSFLFCLRENTISWDTFFSFCQRMFGRFVDSRELVWHFARLDWGTFRTDAVDLFLPLFL